MTREPLRRDGRLLLSPSGAQYPIVHGVPVLLAADTRSTLWVKDASYIGAREAPEDPWQIDTLGLSEAQRSELRTRIQHRRDDSVDPVVSYLVSATSGYMYEDQVGRLTTVPIPDFRLRTSSPKLLLDVGCSWGRWVVAAARAGFVPVGIDPSLGAVLAAKRLCAKLGLEAHFVVGDALALPFAADSFDSAHSYSVLQHFSVEDAVTSIQQLAAVAKPGAEYLIQMPNRFGARCLQHQAKRRFREPSGFEVRYYSPRALLEMFTSNLGPCTLEVDGYFGLGIQPADRHLMSRAKQYVIDASEYLRGLAEVVPSLRSVADSLYVRGTRAKWATGRHSDQARGLR